MSQILRRVKQDRSSRLSADPGLYSCSVRYSLVGENISPRWGQYADISETGMKLISVKPHNTEVGSIIDVNFSLLGGEREVSRKARVVRHANEFVLGLQFLNTSEDFKFLLWQHARFIQSLSWAWPLKRAKKWFTEHKIGLRIALTAMTFFIFTATAIYLFSDDHNNRHRGWNQPYQR